jgi:vacuolar-type H+-ATPase subunit B/Vma2
MQMQSLTIALKQPYSKPGPANPYQAKLSVTYNDNTMQVALSQDACARILALAGEEIAEAAQIQIRDFVQQALSVASAPMIEAVAVDGVGF